MDWLVELKSSVPDSSLNKLIKQTSSLFLHNQWVQNEYPSGMAAMLCEQSADDVCDTIDTTLGIGIYVMSALLG